MTKLKKGAGSGSGELNECKNTTVRYLTHLLQEQDEKEVDSGEKEAIRFDGFGIKHAAYLLDGENDANLAVNHRGSKNG